MKALTDKMIVENAHHEELISALQKHAEVNADIYISLSKIVQNNRGKQTQRLIKKMVKENVRAE